MANEFQQIEWDDQVEEDCRQLVRLAIREDLDRYFDLTTIALVPPEAQGQAAVVAREGAVIAGGPVAAVVLNEMQAQLEWTALVQDGADVAAGTRIARLRGSARDLLSCERILLNFLGRLSGVATLARRHVDAIAHAKARLYDTRKTTPGWRLLEKYAARVGGAHNHRRGLYDGVLIKDNHLALLGGGLESADPANASLSTGSPAAAVRMAGEFLDRAELSASLGRPPVEVEVDTLDQLADALSAGPDLVLLDNMSLDDLRRAVQLRDAAAPQIELEASGGMTLERIPLVASTGVDRISVGGLTHAARSVDLSLDWL